MAISKFGLNIICPPLLKEEKRTTKTQRAQRLFLIFVSFVTLWFSSLTLGYPSAALDLGIAGRCGSCPTLVRLYKRSRLLLHPGHVPATRAPVLSLSTLHIFWQSGAHG